MATRKNVPSMAEEDRAFFMNAYKRDPEAKKAMDAEMKRMGLTYEEYFGIKKNNKQMNDIIRGVKKK